MKMRCYAAVSYSEIVEEPHLTNSPVRRVAVVFIVILLEVPMQEAGWVVVMLMTSMYFVNLQHMADALT